MENLRERVLKGEVTIFSVIDKNGKESQEVLDFVGVLDLTVGTSAERMADLVTLFERNSIEFLGKRYRVKCGFTLIATVMVETAEIMKENAEEIEVAEIGECGI